MRLFIFLCSFEKVYGYYFQDCSPHATKYTIYTTTQSSKFPKGGPNSLGNMGRGKIFRGIGRFSVTPVCMGLFGNYVTTT